MEFKNVENKKYTVTDNNEEKTIYHSRAVTMDILQFVVQAKSETEATLYVLVSERGSASHDFKGKLNVPCGHLDWNETVEEGATREMFEETGFLNTDLQILGINSHPNNNRQNVQVALIGVIEVGMGEELPELKGNEESVNPRWMKFDDIIEQFQTKGNDPEKWAFDHDILIFQIAKDYFKLG